MGDLQRHAIRLTEEALGYTSKRVKITQTQTNYAAATPQTILGAHLEFAVDNRNRRYFDEQFGMKDGGILRVCGYSDGTRCAQMSYYPGKEPLKQKNVLISREFMGENAGYYSAPAPLRWFYVGLRPLHEVLPESESLGTSSVIGRPVDIVRFKSVKSPGSLQDLVFSLDFETSIPLKVEAYENQTSYQEGLPSWTWVAESHDTVGRYHVAKDSLLTTYQEGQNGSTKKPALSIHFKIDEIVYDEPIPSSTFWPEFQPGVQIIDNIKGTITAAPGESKSEAAGPAIQAHPPSAGWGPAGPLTLVGFGVMVIVAAVWMKRKSV